jgi:hypothetical protein
MDGSCVCQQTFMFYQELSKVYQCNQGSNNSLPSKYSTTASKLGVTGIDSGLEVCV